MKEAVIVSAVRTPLGSFNGSLSTVGATQLGAIVIEAAIARAKISKSAVNEVIMGQVLPCGYGQNPAKQAAVRAGMPWEAECITVNKVCGSALKGRDAGGPGHSDRRCRRGCRRRHGKHEHGALLSGKSQVRLPHGTGKAGRSYDS